MGDFNAKNGGFWEGLMDWHGEGAVNPNTERLGDSVRVQFPSYWRSHHFTHAGYFQIMKQENKLTTHISISIKRSRSSLEDMPVYWGVDMSSEHSLVFAKLTIKLERSISNIRKLTKKQSGRP